MVLLQCHGRVHRNCSCTNSPLRTKNREHPCLTCAAALFHSCCRKAREGVKQVLIGALAIQILGGPSSHRGYDICRLARLAYGEDSNVVGCCLYEFDRMEGRAEFSGG